MPVDTAQSVNVVQTGCSTVLCEIETKSFSHTSNWTKSDSGLTVLFLSPLRQESSLISFCKLFTACLALLNKNLKFKTFFNETELHMTSLFDVTCDILESLSFFVCFLLLKDAYDYVFLFLDQNTFSIDYKVSPFIKDRFLISSIIWIQTDYKICKL